METQHPLSAHWYIPLIGEHPHIMETQHYGNTAYIALFLSPCHISRCGLQERGIDIMFYLFTVPIVCFGFIVVIFFIIIFNWRIILTYIISLYISFGSIFVLISNETSTQLWPRKS